MKDKISIIVPVYNSEKYIEKCLKMENISFGECSCSTWDEDGHVMRPCFHSIDELEKLKEYPSPDMSFNVDYVNSDTGKYSYTISASTNNNIITSLLTIKMLIFLSFMSF